MHSCSEFSLCHLESEHVCQVTGGAASAHTRTAPAHTTAYLHLESHSVMHSDLGHSLEDSITKPAAPEGQYKDQSDVSPSS